MSDRRPLREIAAPFVVPAPVGRRIRTRIKVTDTEMDVIWRVGSFLGSQAGTDLKERCRLGRVRAKDTNRAQRKKALTPATSSRWAGALTRVSNDQVAKAYDNAYRHLADLSRAMSAIETPLASPTVDSLPEDAKLPPKRARGYRTRAERYAKQQRLQHLQSTYSQVKGDIEAGSVSVCRGGRRLAKLRHDLGDGGIDEATWRRRWACSRLFVQADGECDKAWGNETIRLSAGGQLSVRLPNALTHLANAPNNRYVLSAPVAFSYRHQEWRAQIDSGAVAYEIWVDPGNGRVYLDASWTQDTGPTPTLAEATAAGAVGVDFNDGFVTAWVCDRTGNPVGAPFDIDIATVDADAPTSRRDAQLRHAITEVLNLADRYGVDAVVCENLSFEDEKSRENPKHRRGKPGRKMRAMTAGMPTRKFADRLTQMAANRSKHVIAVDPAYTSKWGAEHWRRPLQHQQKKNTAKPISRHAAAAVVIARRGLGYRARRRPGMTGTHQSDGNRRATGQANPDTGTLEEHHKPSRDPTATSGRRRNGNVADQAPQHRSGTPTKHNSLLLGV